jgi:pilus assembly protein Flp/PilA
MFAFMRKLQDTRHRDDGASAVEYGLIIAAVAAVIIVAIIAFGGFVQDVFTNTCEEMEAQAPDTAATSTCDENAPAE